MSELVRIVLDAMGGDNAPGEQIKGAVEALQENSRIKVIPKPKEEYSSIGISPISGTK